MDRFRNYEEDELNNPNTDEYDVSETEMYSDSASPTIPYDTYTYENTEYPNSYPQTQLYDEYEEYETGGHNEEYDEYQSYDNDEYQPDHTAEHPYTTSEYSFSNEPATELEDSIFTPLYPESYAPLPSEQVVPPENVSHESEQLTEAELAEIRRKKAIARRKKLAARERRRKIRRRQAIIRCSILLAIVIALLVGLVMLVNSIRNHIEEKEKARKLSEYYATSEVTTEEPVAEIDPEIIAKELPEDRDAALIILQKQAESDSSIQSICDSAAALPDVLLQYLAINPELKDYTLSYPALINVVFDGDFEVEVTPDEVPLYLQYDERWGYADYSTDILALRGAGPTTLSMAYTYLLSDGSKNPIVIADYATDKGYLDEDGNTHWSLITKGATSLGLKSTEIDVKKEEMITALEDGKLLICKLSSGDFTKDNQHFILIHSYKDGFFYLHDPFSAARSEVGWDFKRLRGQIDKIAALEKGSGQSDDSSDTNDDSSESADNDTNPEPSSESANDDADAKQAPETDTQ